jgi:hypothetical protein
MELSVYLRFLSALVFTLSLIGLLYWSIKRFNLMKFSNNKVLGNRLSVEEILRIDAKNKLVSVKKDEEEYLILIGQDGNLLIDASESRNNKIVEFRDELEAQNKKPQKL